MAPNRLLVRMGQAETTPPEWETGVEQQPLEEKVMSLDDLLPLLREKVTWSAPTTRLRDEVAMLQAAEPKLEEKARTQAEEVQARATDLATEALREELGLARGYQEAVEALSRASERARRTALAVEALEARLALALPQALRAVMAQDIDAAHTQAIEDVDEFRDNLLNTFGTENQAFETPSQAQAAWAALVNRRDSLARARATVMGLRQPTPPAAPWLIRPDDVDTCRQSGRAESVCELLAVWGERLATTS